ncbi:MAG: PQQ-like beta-propeller repeat protein, partial [Verrucomicrobia bacterium]|nr:PQQ-like beta-propeller repeat protein [Verrucomicrobiota bacterium]
MILSKMITLLACCATVSFGGWGTYHGGADLRGVSEIALPEKPVLLWRYHAGGAVYNTPVSDGARIFFSAKKGQIISIDLKGSEVWKKNFTRTTDAGMEVPVRFEASLACGGGLVLAGSTHGTLYALDAMSGATTWKYETGGIIIGSPNLLCKRTVVVLDQSEGALHCVDLESGKPLWKTEGVERCDGSPGVGNGRIVFGSCLAALHVYSEEGKHLKDVEIGGDAQVAGGVAIDGNLVFAGARDGSLVCADAEAGDIVWRSDASEDQTFSTPAVAQDKVIYCSDDGLVYAVDRAEGNLIWKFDTDGLPTSPVVAKEKVVVAADGV